MRKRKRLEWMQNRCIQECVGVRCVCVCMHEMGGRTCCQLRAAACAKNTSCMYGRHTAPHKGVVASLRLVKRIKKLESLGSLGSCARTATERNTHTAIGRHISVVQAHQCFNGRFERVHFHQHHFRILAAECETTREQTTTSAAMNPCQYQCHTTQ